MRRLAVLGVVAACAAVMAAGPARPRARDIGIAPGVFPPGPHNAITDVPDVRVGHTTLVGGETVRTGVTAIVPHGGNVFREKVAGGVFVGNGFGKLTGTTQIDELGTIETPIILTNTLSVGVAMDAVAAYTLTSPGNEAVRSVNAVVGETNDGMLNDIRGRHVTREDVTAAITGAVTGPVDEGTVGAGTGTVCFGWKGGIGTASRVVPVGQASYTLGVLVQTNFGGVLTIDGVKVGQALGRYAFAPEPPRVEHNSADGSCMIVVATDAPMDARDLKRVAARAVYALARTGSSFSNGSGDYAVAFSNAPAVRSIHGEREPRARMVLPPDAIAPLFQATLEATEEAVYNSLLRATTVTAGPRTVEALPIDKLLALLKGRQ
jgi:D-aminopeptidase